MTSLAGIGVDAGSTTCKVVGVDASGAFVGYRLAVAHPRIEEQAASLVEDLAREHGAPPDVTVVATGYGRKLVKRATRSVTEITCHACGVFAELRQAGTLVDIGGQDSKVIVVGAGGRVVDFAMNDKCAAGTGRFLEYTASRLGVGLEEMGGRAMAAAGEEAISSTCTVFAESEIISLIARGAQVDAILRGLHRSLASRVVSMVKSVGLRPPLMLSGGVAKNPALRALLSEGLEQSVRLPREPQLTGAYGAALLAQGWVPG